MKSGCIAGRPMPNGMQLKLTLAVVSLALVLSPKSSSAETHLKIRQLTPAVSYGSTPLTATDFNLLKAKGFNTIISVDGVAPNLNFSGFRDHSIMSIFRSGTRVLTGNKHWIYPKPSMQHPEESISIAITESTVHRLPPSLHVQGMEACRSTRSPKSCRQTHL